jgi:hypothetical protein
MTMLSRRPSTVGFLIALWLGGLARAADLPPWVAAYIQPGAEKVAVVLFPITGGKAVVPLPGKLAQTFIVYGSTDGKALYLWEPGEISKLEFNPVRQMVVPGSSGLGRVWSLTVVAATGHIFFSGMAGGYCGTFEVNPADGTQRAVLEGGAPVCGGGGGVVSPDGARSVRHVRGELRVTDLRTGASQVVSGFKDETVTEELNWLNATAWSPDGRWISVVDASGRVTLIGVDDFGRRKRLGSTAGGVAASWSPDSRYLLVSKPGLGCALSLYFVSLEAVDIETGRRIEIGSSRCQVTGGWVGWLDPSVAQ